MKTGAHTIKTNQTKKTGEITMTTGRLLPFSEVRKLTGLSRTTIWKLEASGKFPVRRLLTENRVAWLEDEIREWIAQRSPVTQESGGPAPKHNLPQRKARSADGKDNQ